ncbi:MAG: hypothetical protein JNK58_11300 [Phycisphaerae bacterium]|nr:hypothetical protein [Phycisphaerae bacterium]
MKRSEFEHVIRAAAAIVGVDRLVVIGSQAVHGQFPDPPSDLLLSMEADIVSPENLGHADLIDGAIGELSPFHETFGYYGHGVRESVAVLPKGWRERLIPFRTRNTGNATALCLEVHDLAVSKLVAGREKDIAFVRLLLQHGMADFAILRQRVAETELAGAVRSEADARLSRLVPVV